MLKVVITSVRLDSSVDFHRYDDDMYDYIDDEFVKSGDMLSYKVSVDITGTTETCAMLFDSEEAYLSFKKDPVIAYHEPKKVRYNIIHRIAVSTNLADITVSKDLYNIYLR